MSCGGGEGVEIGVWLLSHGMTSAGDWKLTEDQGGGKIDNIRASWRP